LEHEEAAIRMDHGLYNKRTPRLALPDQPPPSCAIYETLSWHMMQDSTLTSHRDSRSTLLLS